MAGTNTADCAPVADEAYLADLFGLASYLDRQDDLDASLEQLAAISARLLGARRCSIMLLKGGDEGPRLRVLAHYGDLPASAYRDDQRIDQGIAGKVATDGRPLLVPAIEDSDLGAQSRRGVASGGFVAAPIVIAGQVVGVLNISDPSDRPALEQHDLRQTTIVALLVGKAIHVHQLQRLLSSNFAQRSVARDGDPASLPTMAAVGQDAPRMARILAHTFYREMHQAGFGADHILTAATELIGLISHGLEAPPATDADR